MTANTLHAMDDMEGCLACDLTTGRHPLPGGVIHETERWRVEHCVGPLGVGTLVVKPLRHVTRVSELTAAEADEQGALLQMCAGLVDGLLSPEQTYVCLWSHAGGEPGHLHYVVQPISRALMEELGTHGPWLQARMFDAGEPPAPEEVEAFAHRARHALSRAQAS